VRNNVSTSNLITKTVYHILFYFARKIYQNFLPRNCKSKH